MKRKIFFLASIVATCALLIPAATAKALGVSDADTTEVQEQTANTGPNKVLIKNVYLIGRQGGIDNIYAHILIVAGRLSLVTRDNIQHGQATTALDGRNGFLMGNLLMGQPPSFVILNQDPRENFDIFLNTNAYVTFAMDKGRIVRNDLPELPADSLIAENSTSSWTAYNPPPMAVPFNYYDSRKWNKFETAYISGLLTGALALDRLRWVSQDDVSSNQVGDLSESSVGALRGLRLGLVGTVNFKQPWIYTFFMASAAFDKGFDPEARKDLILYDLRLDIPLPADMNLSIGKQKEPISLERLTMLFFIPWQERSAAADAFIPARNTGVVLNSRSSGSRSSWAFGAFNNWIESGNSFKNNSYQLVGRVTGIPYLTPDESNLLHLGLGFRYSNAQQAIRGKTEAEFYQAPIFVDTDSFPANDLYTYSLEIYWRKGPFLVGFEYLGTNTASPDFGDPKFYGYNISGTWTLTGEMRKYRKQNGIFYPVPVAVPVDQGGWGAWEAAFRYSTLDLSAGLIDGGKMDTYSLALNWWLNPRIQFSLNYRYITLARFDGDGRSSGINLRLSLIFE